ncbi:hypothetical protein GE061_020013 [Apolygus lucorum]|uniref:Regulatory protein zeste n=1 Tax=Apolygus lucorum TaxID=248454 RepID=A0A8S9XB94_APOLU|nr:hypothetical protein GE061_020013 [Apolygus lucorum]
MRTVLSTICLIPTVYVLFCEMDKKRIAFSESEKVRLRELVMERRDVVENRKSDVNSLMEKKRAWDVITADFNSSGQFPNRSVVQLKRLWENVKARRKAQLSAEKRERFKTGGGPSAQIADEDAELDSLGVDVEIVDAIDSDTGRLAPRSVEVVGMDEVQENGACTNPEVISRIKRNEEFNQRAGEIHVLKMKEQQQKVELVNLQIKFAKREDFRARQLHMARMKLHMARMKRFNKLKK